MKNFRYKVQAFAFVTCVLLVYGIGFNVEAYCPFGAIESAFTWLEQGRLICSLGSGNYFALAAVVLSTLLLGRVFCGYICPLGAIGAFLRHFAGDFGFKQWNPSRRTDRILGLGKYLVLVIILFLTARAVDMVLRKVSPCYLLVSVNNDIAVTAWLAGGIFVIGSFLVSLPFCRWLCPFGAVLNIFALLSLTKVSRDMAGCTGCGKCSRKCPMNIDVASCKTVNSPACISCLECIEVCPAKNLQGEKVLSWRFFGRFSLRRSSRIIGVVLLLAVASVSLASIFVDIPTFYYTRELAEPAKIAYEELEIKGVTCAGSAQLFAHYLNRKDILAIEGYLTFATRPRDGWIRVSVGYDPAQTDRQAIIEAIIEPYYEEAEKRWRPSTFEVKGVELIE